MRSSATVLLALLLFSLQVSHARQFWVRFTGTEAIPDEALFNRTGKVFVNSTLVARVGNAEAVTFDLPTGSAHLLTFWHPLYTFDACKVLIANETAKPEVSATRLGAAWAQEGEPVRLQAGVLAVSPVSTKVFVLPPQGFNPMSLLSNPMILISGVTVAMTYFMPKVVNNLDPDGTTKSAAEQNVRGQDVLEYFQAIEN
ncbi:hypothetical protein RI367_008308 [Sorochytrium milnesiophthora]